MKRMLYNQLHYNLSTYISEFHNENEIKITKSQKPEQFVVINRIIVVMTILNFK